MKNMIVSVRPRLTA